jgi:hypothetical protein
VKVRATANAGIVHVEWNDSKPRSAQGFYRILRAPGVDGGLGCAGRVNNSADNCSLYMESPAVRGTTSFEEPLPPGVWTYRIGVAANWLNDPTLGDVYVVSRPVTVTVR